MRLGADMLGVLKDPECWAEAVRSEGYRAAVFPVSHKAEEAEQEAYVRAAGKRDIVIAEVGAWSNPLNPDPKQQREAIRNCQKQLELAERVGARCCVNIAGSRGDQWDGPHPDNFSDETFALIVDTVRDIIDAVNPKRTFYALEAMPWIFPDTADNYLALLKAIDRPGMAVHFDPANLVVSPRLYYHNDEMIRGFFAKLGPYIKSVHAKDILLRPHLTVHLEEVRPGQGGLDYRVLLTELKRLDPDTTLIIEHLKSEAEYREAAKYIRGTARELGIDIDREDSLR